MDIRKDKEEALEELWYGSENGDAVSLDPALVKELKADGLARSAGDSITLTKNGTEIARRLIRSHRIAERLVHDVLGAEFEQGACEFEHIVNPDLVDSICTLLGHPRECPHGMPIPEGQCCKSRQRSVESSVIPLDQLAIGETARVAYVYAPNDQQMHRLDNLLVRPGAEVRMHQRRPSFVIECEDTVIALDERVAANIHVWAGSRPARRPRHGHRHRGS